MIIFIEAMIVLAILYFVYRSIFTKNNPLGISKLFGITILLVGVFILPPPVKALIVVIVILYFIIKKTSQKNIFKRIENND